MGTLVHVLLLLQPWGRCIPATQTGQSRTQEVTTSPIVITLEEGQKGTRVSLSGQEEIRDFVSRTLDNPERIALDIFITVPSFDSITVPVKSKRLKRIRVGYHPERIRVVLDLRGPRIPQFTTRPTARGIVILLGSESARGDEKNLLGPGDEEQGKKIVEQPSSQGRNVPPGDQGEEAIRHTFKVISVSERLTEDEIRGDPEEAALLRKGIKAYKARDWSGAIGLLRRLIEKYPHGKLTERAYFLLAKSYGRLYSDSPSSRFRELEEHYKRAINRFPKSIYVAAALLDLGNLYLENKNYYEAVGYYNLVVKRRMKSIEALRALLQKARILRVKRRMDEALSVLTQATERYPDLPEKTEAEVELSKILYEINSFSRSIKILTDIIARDPRNIYRYPEISLYLGYNYAQVGDHVKARNYLFRYYNCFPESKQSPLVLTQIGDNYRDDGLISKAVKFYTLVLKRYPDTEAAVISRLRLAEEQEQGNLDRKTSEMIGSSLQVYKSVLDHPPGENGKSPLAQLAMLKLAMLHKKNGEYEKSLRTLKLLLKRNIPVALKGQAEHAVKETLGAMLQTEMRKGDFPQVINMYAKEKTLFSLVNDADLFLTVARACLSLKLDDTAGEMFEKADSLLMDGEKPPDLLFYTGLRAFRRGDLKKTLKRISLLIKRFPKSRFLPDAYRLKGRVLAEQKRYQEAGEAFSSALTLFREPCERADLLLYMANVFVEEGRREEALSALRETEGLKENCGSEHYRLYCRMGDLYLRLGHREEALSVFNEALEMVPEEESSVLLRLKIAHCYRLLHREEESLGLYEQVADLNMPFWSGVARENMEQIIFDRELRAQSTENR